MKTSRSEILDLLINFQKTQSAEYGLSRLGVFGSVARDQMTDESDVDVVVDLAEPNLLTLAAIMIRLEELLGRPVDVVHYRGMRNEYLKRRIDREAIYVGRESRPHTRLGHRVAR